MKRFLKWLKRFFLPPEGTPLWQRILPYAVLGLLTILVLISGAFAWEYTNSPEFCGTACHTMPPEYTSYLTSPHARVECVDCHIGEGFITTRITRKAGDAKHIISLLFKDYEFPIEAHKMRPSRDTCELCHFPAKFSDDSLREIKQFSNDVENTPQSIYLVMKTGGGSARLGLGRGIHWHIENPVYYFAADEDHQEIPYVQVVSENGEVTEFFDIEAEIDPDDIATENLQEMDCITCHNRVTHLVIPPEDTVDQLLQHGQISTSIPEIRRVGVEILYGPYETSKKGLEGIAGIVDFYEANYPQFFENNPELLEQAVNSLQQAYSQSVYPEQKSDWDSHPNNIGHEFSPGCFRCHDGKHLNDLDEAIRLECNVCHSIPVVAGTTDFVAEIEISRGPEPESHLNPNWISLHRDVFDPTCENCHTTEDPGDISNTSFCSNSACHGNVWEYAGFDAPALRAVLIEQLPPPVEEQTENPGEGALTFGGTIGSLLEVQCGSCHGEGGIGGLELTSYNGVISGGGSGEVLNFDDPANSLLITKQTGEQAHFGQFNAEELELVIQWIVDGAPE